MPETPAAEGLTLSPKRGEGPARRSSVSRRPLSVVRSLSPAYGLEQSLSVPLARGLTTSRRMPSVPIDLYLEPESEVD